MNRPEPTGALGKGSEGPEIRISRDIDASIGEVWSFLTRSDLLARWYGTWSGDPSEGVVRLAMVEAPAAPEPCRINRCEPPWILDVTISNAEAESWNLELRLEEVGDRTHLEFRQPLGELVADAGDIGPGWEYYLDRLTAALQGQPVHDIDFNWYHPHQVEHYRSF